MTNDVLSSLKLWGNGERVDTLGRGEKVSGSPLSVRRLACFRDLEPHGTTVT